MSLGSAFFRLQNTKMCGTSDSPKFSNAMCLVSVLSEVKLSNVAFFGQVMLQICQSLKVKICHAEDRVENTHSGKMAHIAIGTCDNQSL